MKKKHSHLKRALDANRETVDLSKMISGSPVDLLPGESDIDRYVEFAKLASADDHSGTYHWDLSSIETPAQLRSILSGVCVAEWAQSMRKLIEADPDGIIELMRRHIMCSNVDKYRITQLRNTIESLKSEEDE